MELNGTEASQRVPGCPQLSRTKPKRNCAVPRLQQEAARGAGAGDGGSFATVAADMQTYSNFQDDVPAKCQARHKDFTMQQR
ncbi:hypothetical protein AWZ03_012058 [Drosophila navojoa]|uniref:Uncharacterized protein n=1 Tax=Drosophila navojoa TaxID=7232 RepID=A0A484AY40_DRONA|nr:hypothetical protein AWZ03_012058 [Drosophila navojoa]